MDFPGKNTGVGCHFLLQCMKVKSESEVVQSCPTLRDPMDCSLLDSSTAFYLISLPRILYLDQPELLAKPHMSFSHTLWIQYLLHYILITCDLLLSSIDKGFLKGRDTAFAPICIHFRQCLQESRCWINAGWKLHAHWRSLYIYFSTGKGLHIEGSRNLSYVLMIFLHLWNISNHCLMLWKFICWRILCHGWQPEITKWEKLQKGQCHILTINFFFFLFKFSP